MRQPIEIRLTDLPPSANGLRKSFIKNGRVMSAKTDAYTKWREAAVWEIAAQRQGTMTGPYRLKIRAQRHWRSKRARDIDNLLKPLSDALVKAGTVSDDSLAESVYAEWADDVAGVLIEVTGL
jgi:Holliday junction resolvase RusA-like endonuclease